MPYHLLFETQDRFNEYFLEGEENSITHLPNINDINIIIGSNNSGKSRFIRGLMLGKSFKLLNEEAFKNYNRYIDTRSWNIRHNDKRFISKIPLNFDFDKTLIGNSELLLDYFNAHLVHHNDLLNDISNNLYVELSPMNYFIPTLRTAHSLYSNSKKIDNDIYLETLTQYHKIDESVQIFTGQQLYKNVLNARNARKDIRKRFEEFEKFLSKNFFDGREVDVVAEFNKDDSLKGSNSGEIIRVHVDGEEDRFLYQLGDGIQAIIILMYQIFMAEPGSNIFIDEPELNLHPGMRRLFLEQLCYNEELKKNDLTYFITTHSNHFLDLTIEKDNVSIYSFSPREGDNKEKQFVIKNVNAGDNEILKHLGVNNSSVFMANCSIWVEGISDRSYIKAFLYAYLESIKNTDDYKSIKEDIDFAFFEYAGSNIDHYFFGDLQDIQEREVIKDINALALHNRIFLLADSDCADNDTAKKQRLEKLKNAQRPNFVPKIIEGVREIENLLMNGVWQEVLIEFCNKNLVNSNREEVNSKIKEALKSYHAEDYHSQYIGTFLSKLRTKMGDINGHKILNESCYVTKPKLGTFVYKRELSELVLKKVHSKEITWADFKENPHIETLTKEIYNFIVHSKN